MKLIKDYLELTGKSQRELARDMGMDVCALNNILRGRRKAGAATFLKLNKATGITIDKILEAAAAEYGTT